MSSSGQFVVGMIALGLIGTLVVVTAISLAGLVGPNYLVGLVGPRPLDRHIGRAVVL